MIRLVLPTGEAERLRWTDHHAVSSFGLGVVLRGHSSEVLDGPTFASLVNQGARIECSTDLECRRVAGALGLTMLAESANAIVVEGDSK